MDPPPSHHHYHQNPLYLHPPPSAAYPVPSIAPSQPQNPTFYTPMSPYQTPKPTPPFSSLSHPPIPTAAFPYPSYAPTSTVFYPLSSSSSSSNVGFPQHAAWYPVPRSRTIFNNPPIRQPNPNDDYIRRLRNEVIFLHALWHQGPPDSNYNSHLNSIGDPVEENLHFHLKPSPSTSFKKKKKNPRPCPVSDNPWSVPPDPPAPPVSESGWPEFPPRPTSPAPVASDEDRARVSAIRVQQKAFRSFFAGKHGSESESESDDDEDDHDDRAKFDKFFEVFQGDEELRVYYDKNWANGEFLCLVCGGTGQMVGRKYKNCVALVQHTITISNTKKRAAHRAYGQVVCKVLGWDIDKLHVVSRNLSLQQGNDMSSAEACKDDPVGVETNIASLVHENVQPDPSKATSDVGEDNVTEKDTSDLPSVVDNPGDQQINDTSNAGSSKHQLDTAEENTFAIFNEHGLSDTPKAGTDTGDDNAADKKEASSLPCSLTGSEC